MATTLSDSGINPLALPPAVAYPLAAPQGLRRLSVLVWSLVVVVDGYWLAVAPTGDWRPWLGLLVSVGVGGLAWRAGPLVQSGRLVWDGAFWCWEQSSGSVGGRVVVRLDVQSGLLLWFIAESGPNRWFWLSRHSSPANWLALRRAAHAVSAPPFSTGLASRNRAVNS